MKTHTKIKNNIINTCLTAVFNPIVTYESIIPDKNKIQSYFEGGVIVFLALVTHMASIYLTHAPLASVDPLDASMLIEIARIIIPFFTWIISYYAVTSIMDGETSIDEIFVASAYSLIPYIVVTSLMAVLSNIMANEEVGLFNFINSFMWIWMGFLFFLNLKIMNNYSLKKSILVFSVVLFGMALIWALAILFYVLTNNLWTFVATVQRELHILGLERAW